MRKKLKLQEFKELGFMYRAVVREGVSDDEQMDLTERLILEVLEPRSLQMGGSLRSAFVASSRRGTASNEDLETVRAWFAAQSDVEWFDVGPLEDAWYGDPEGDANGTPAAIVIARLKSKLEAARLYLRQRGRTKGKLE